MKTKTAILLLVIILSACAPAMTPTAIPSAIPPTPSVTATQEYIQGETSDQCIPPIVTWEFAMEPPRSKTPLPVVPPSSEWKFQTSLPEKNLYGYLELIEHHQGYDVVWVHIGEKYFRYRTDTEQWGTASFENETENDNLSWIFQDQNGKVWNLATSGQYFRFFRFSDNEQFEPINSSGVRGEIIFDRSQPPLVDKDNTFWFLAYDMPNQMSLFSFDPDTGETSTHLSGEYDAAYNPPYPFGRSIAFGRDGSIFLMRLKDAVIVRYDPSTSTSNDIVSLRSFDNKLTGFLGPDLFLIGEEIYGSRITPG